MKKIVANARHRELVADSISSLIMEYNCNPKRKFQKRM